MLSNKNKSDLPPLDSNPPADDPEDRYVKYVPKTEFGRRMLELRRAVEASGVKMLTREEVRAEVRARRGGVDDSDLY